jgi:hypothetical protein
MAGNIAVGIALVSALAADEMPAPPQGDMTGSWQVSIVGGPNPICKFTQNDKFFGGSCESPAAAGVAFGTIDAVSVRWSYQWTGKSDGAVGAFEFIGKMSGPGLISGTMLMTTGPGTFKFTAQRAE